MFEYNIRKTSKAFSLIEVLVSLAILLAGIVTIINVFPMTLKASNDAVYLSKAVVLAQQKAEEMRRDNLDPQYFVNTIKLLMTPTAKHPFPQEPNLTYSFAGLSQLDAIDDPGDPRDDVGVARVIIRYNRTYRPTEDVLYELRFDE